MIRGHVEQVDVLDGLAVGIVEVVFTNVFLVFVQGATSADLRITGVAVHLSS